MVKQQNREIIRRSRLTDNLLWLLRWPRLLCSWAINWVFDTFFERIIEIKIEDKSDVDFLARSFTAYLIHTIEMIQPILLGN